MFGLAIAGAVEHDFEVEARDIEGKFEQNLQPGETKTLEVDHRPATFGGLPLP